MLAKEILDYYMIEREMLTKAFMHNTPSSIIR